MDPLPSAPGNPRPDQALSFASVADAYDRARPSYPMEAVAWMVGRRPATVVEVGAGTGKLTDRLVELGHDVLATDPLEVMLRHLRVPYSQVGVVPGPRHGLP